MRHFADDDLLKSIRVYIGVYVREIILPMYLFKCSEAFTHTCNRYEAAKAELAHGIPSPAVVDDHYFFIRVLYGKFHGQGPAVITISA